VARSVSIDDLLNARLSLGLLVCALIGVVTTVFDVILRRRRARWRFVYATVPDAWARERGSLPPTPGGRNAADGA
jgi:hypothetical protein